jgi:hypothetical protein
MVGDGTSDDELMALVRTLAAGSTTTVVQILKTRPQLARACFVIKGATRHAARDYFLTEIGHYVYAGDTALHMAAAAYRTEIVHQLIAQGADVRARKSSRRRAAASRRHGHAGRKPLQSAGADGDYRYSY